MRRVVAVLAAGLLLAACAEEPTADRQALRFRACAAPLPGWDQVPAERAALLRVSCATLRVPVDHERPDGAQYSLAVVRIRSTDQADRIGSLVLNPGGPGLAGLAFAAGWATSLSGAVLARFDLVTFDPRGTGASEAIDCGGEDVDFAAHSDLVTPSGYADAAGATRRGTGRCLRRLGDRAASFGTQDVARDLDVLRAALGDRRLSFAGFSYGARLGGEYARQFPGRVRALVLDAPPDPVANPLRIAEDRLVQFERSLDAWAADCPARPTCDGIGADPHGYVERLVADAQREPIVSRRPAPDPAATGAHVVLAVQVLLYSADLWPWLDQALQEAADGDAGSLFEAIDNAFGGNTVAAGDPDPADAGLVISCTDRPAGPTEAAVRSTAVRLARELPLFGRYRAEELFGCAFWTAGRHPVPPPTTSASGRVLVVGTVGDPSTPYAGAQRFASAVGGARLLTYEGEGHTAYGRSACIDDLVDAFLLRRTLPPPGTRCPA